MSSFFGLEIGRRALTANQVAIDVTGNNIANANTAGYSRQRVELTASAPYTLPALNKPGGAGQLGTGVSAEQIIRLRDNFADAMLRNQVSNQGLWDAKGEVLSKIEGLVTDSSGSGLTQVLDDFFLGWQEMSKDPGVNNRVILTEKATALTSYLNDFSGQLDQLGKDLNQVLTGKVDELNTITGQIAELNKQINKVEQGREIEGPTGKIIIRDNNANDLRDKRDLLLDQLAKFGTLKYTEDGVSGMVSVTLGEYQVVNGDKFSKVSTSLDASGNVQVNANLGNGELSGYLAGRDDSLSKFHSDLDRLANELINQVNTLHKQGVDLAGNMGGDFFVGSSAGDIKLNPELAANVNKIAAAKVPAGYPNVQPASGDGSNALAIAGIQNKLTPRSGGIIDLGQADSSQTLSGFWQNSVFNLGLAGKEAKSRSENHELLVTQMENRRQEVSGVSLDEEMTNMLKYQHGYNAAARIINVMDEMLDTIVNRLGNGGR